jgi:hypothetical protein
VYHKHVGKIIVDPSKLLTLCYVKQCVKNVYIYAALFALSRAKIKISLALPRRGGTKRDDGAPYA